MRAPGFWMYETSGVLRPAVEAYLAGVPLSSVQIAAMRAYLRQWIAGDCWVVDDELIWLRANIDALDTRDKISAWLKRAVAANIDPL